MRPKPFTPILIDMVDAVGSKDCNCEHRGRKVRPVSAGDHEAQSKKATEASQKK